MERNIDNIIIDDITTRVYSDNRGWIDSTKGIDSIVSSIVTGILKDRPIDVYQYCRREYGHTTVTREEFDERIG